jgi:hypothetical protein
LLRQNIKKNRVANTVEKQGNLIEANPGKNGRMMQSINNILHITENYGSNRKGRQTFTRKSKPGLLPAVTTRSDG